MVEPLQCLLELENTLEQEIILWRAKFPAATRKLIDEKLALLNRLRSRSHLRARERLFKHMQKHKNATTNVVNNKQKHKKEKLTKQNCDLQIDPITLAEHKSKKRLLRSINAARAKAPRGKSNQLYLP